VTLSFDLKNLTSLSLSQTAPNSSIWWDSLYRTRMHRPLEDTIISVNGTFFATY